jgi:hypothetical protein
MLPLAAAAATSLQTHGSAEIARAEDIFQVSQRLVTDTVSSVPARGAIRGKRADATVALVDEQRRGLRGRRAVGLLRTIREGKPLLLVFLN